MESANGRVKANVVVVDGKEEHHPEGCYYIEWREGDPPKRRRLSVGRDHLKAHAAKLRKETELAALSRGVELAASPDNGRRSIAIAVAGFLEDTKLTKKPKTLAAYSKALSYFTESCAKIFLEDIERRDLLNFAFLRDEKELHPRTCWNKFSNVMSFLKANDYSPRLARTHGSRVYDAVSEVSARQGHPRAGQRNIRAIRECG